MTKPLSILWLYFATALFAGVILLISISATMEWGLDYFARVRQIPGGDKLAHFILMGGFSLLVNLSLRTRQIQVLGGSILLGSLVLYLLVTIEEFTQMLLPSRSFDLLDLASNYLGILLFGWLAIRLNSRPSKTDDELS